MLLRLTAMTLSMVIAPTAVVWARDSQLGDLFSPGRLSRPHSQLEGVRQCQACHEPGRRVTATRCLACHKPVAARIAAGKGIHRDVKDTCTPCHQEHQGEAADVRAFDTRVFNHARDTDFPLDGKHSTLAQNCGACHKTRSFLAVTSECSACHRDPHKGALGASCLDCHSTATNFREANWTFDHTKTEFPLTGRHRTAACSACHKNQTYKEIAFERCSDCHADPHEKRFAQTCESCHTTERWLTSRIDHDRTAYPLRGRHVDVECGQCHRQPPLKVKPRSDSCASCHSDPHRGRFPQDCASCHTVSGFGKAPFDHATTPFPLTGKHASLGCERCHKRPPIARANRRAGALVDFGGLRADCGSCHADTHEGEFGARLCQTCHGTSSFRLESYAHTGAADFFGTQHSGLACGRCHKPREEGPAPIAARPPGTRILYTAASTACMTCHADVHLGQVGSGCEQCHRVSAPKFAPVAFSHERSAFPLTGKHEMLPCTRCHRRETAVFRGGAGTALRLTGIGTSCQSCHADVHLGQIGAGCETCHATTTFRVVQYEHRNTSLAFFFVGPHRGAACGRCHKSVTARFPAGQGTTVQYAVDPRCVSCHVDVHRGQLGDRCIDCHRLSGRSQDSRGRR